MLTIIYLKTSTTTGNSLYIKALSFTLSEILSLLFSLHFDLELQSCDT